MNQFLQVIIIAEEQNITRAATRLNISQPALTLSINKLEEELGVKLFNRRNSPIKLTEAGLLYIQEMKKIEELAFNLKSRLVSLGTEKKKFTIGIGVGRGRYWLPLIMPDLIHAFPDVQFSIYMGNYAKLEKSLEERNVDLAFGSLNVDSDHFVRKHLCDETLIYIIPKSLGLLDASRYATNTYNSLIKIEASMLDGQPFISTTTGTSYRRYIEAEMKAYNYTTNDSLFCDDPELAIRLCSNGLGIFYTSLSIVKSKLTQKDIDYTQLYFCTLRDTPNTQRVNCFFPRNSTKQEIIDSIIEIFDTNVKPVLYL